MKRPCLLILIACILGELACNHIGIIVILWAIPIWIASFFIIKGKFSKYKNYYFIFSAAFIFMYFNTAVKAHSINEFTDRYSKESYIEYIAKVQDIKEGKGIYKIKVGHMLVDYKSTNMEYAIGNTLRVKGMVKAIKEKRNEGEFNRKSYYYSQGIYLLLNAKSIERLDASKDFVKDIMRIIKMRIIKEIDKGYNENEAGIIRAILLGDKSALDRDIYKLYSRNGIAHILAISGLHISIIGLLFYKALRKILGYGISIICSISVIAFYGILINNSVSIGRAIIMIFIFFLSEYIGRSYDLLNASFISAIIILFFNPMQLYQPSFILSFTAIFSIIFSQKILKVIDIKNMSLNTVLLGLLMQIFSLPVILYFFYRIPLYSFILNLFILPLMPILIIASIISLIPITAYFYSVNVFRLSVALIIKIYNFLSAIFSEIPLSSIIVGKPGLFKIFLYYILLILIYFYIIKIKNRFFIIVLMLPGLLFFMHNKDGIEINFLDVGQGDGIYISYGGEDILVDCGSSDNKNIGRDTLEPFLFAKGVSDIEKIFITHADSDHSNGILYLLNNVKDIDIDAIYLPKQAKEYKEYENIKELARKRKIGIYYVGARDIIMQNKEFYLECISPQNKDISKINEQSIVLFLKYKYFSAVFMGDAGLSSEDIIMKDKFIRKKLKNIDLVKIGHHGSKSSSGEAFVSYLNPSISIFSYGRNNIYSHPDINVYKRVSQYSKYIYSTERDGSIDIFSNGKKIKLIPFIKQ